MTKWSAVLIVDPAAGMRHAGRDDLEDVVGILRGAFDPLDVAECRAAGPTAGDLARTALVEGRGAVIVAGGDMHDGLLDVAVFPRMGRRELLWSLVRLWRDASVQVAPIVLHEPAVRISADAPLAVHADGRLAGRLPAEFHCRPGALAVYAP